MTDFVTMHKIDSGVQESKFNVSKFSDPLCSKNTPIVCSYFVFMLVTGIVLREFSDRDFSFVLTLGSGIQCLGFFLLLQRVNRERSCAGISSKMLEMYVLVFCFRLMATTRKVGYLPVDRSGEWVVQAADFASLLVVFQLLWKMHKCYLGTYQSELDSLDIWRAVPVALLVAVCLHGNLNKSAFYDTVWTFSMHCDTIAMLPQYYMMIKKGGEVELLTSHFIASQVVRGALWCAFWYYGYTALAIKKGPKAGSFNISGYWILGCHILQLLMSGDFMYHYIKSAWLKVKMVLPEGMLHDV